jgi:tetratricopeptide (TPR) repeat protein
MTNQNSHKSVGLMSILSLIATVATLVLVVYLTFATQAGERDHQTEKNLAGELADNNLPKAAIEEYKKILADPDVDKAAAANINYLIAKIYFEEMADYENAAAYYLRARILNPSGSFFDEAGRNMISCLEKMGRMVDAKRELDAAVNLDSAKTREKGEKVLARVGSTTILNSDLDDAIQSLPPETQKRFLDRAGKIEILNNLVAQELIYKAAMREGFDRDPDFVRKRKQVEKQLLMEKYLVEKALPQVNIDTADVRNYYLANRAAKYGDKPYDEVKANVLMDYQREKSRKVFAEYIAKLAELEKTQIFEENIR